MKTKQKFDSPKSTFWAGMFYLFLSLTLLASVLHLFGLNWFECRMNIPEPNLVIQKIVKASLKVFELIFVYKILTCMSTLTCFGISTVEVIAVGFIPNHFQGIADLIVMTVVSLCSRKDKLNATVDLIALFILMNAYSILFELLKFGIIGESNKFSFYTGVVSLFDYKLFIITLYMYIKYKGGIKLWRMKRKLFQKV